MMKKALRVVAFLLVLALCYGAVDTVLKIKTYDMRSLITLGQMEDDTLDVVMVGSSHVGMNIDNRQLWQEKGIASYNVWVGMQPVWNSYYYLKEAIAAQQPEVAIVEVFLCGTTAEYSTKAVAMKNITTMPMGLNRLQAALASFEKWQDAVEAMWGMPYYHNRFDELTADDLAGRYGWDEEIIPTVHQTSDVITPIELMDYRTIEGTLPLTEKNEEYVRKIIDLCKAKDVSLVLMVAPYQATEEECMRLNSIGEIAAEEGVPFLNYLKLWQEQGIDPQTDFYDIGHFNNAGIRKFTSMVGDYLQENYQLEDRRADTSHPWYGVEEVQTAVLAPAFSLTEVFRGDGMQRFVDTGIELFRERFGSWTLLTRVDAAAIAEGDSVYLSCFSEEDAADYRGLLLRQNGGRLELILGANNKVRLPLTDSQVIDLAIVKDGEKYNVYYDGQWVCWQETRSCSAYSGTLLVGCQELSAKGERFRYSPTTILNLEVYSSALSKEAVEAWQPENLPEPELPLGIGMSDAKQVYVLPEQFVGDSSKWVQDDWIDTGVKLFADPATRFTLSTMIVPEYEPGDNVFLSCFREKENEYGGLLIRQIEPNSINIVYGNHINISVPCVNRKPMTIKVVKDVDRYSIYVDGQKVVSEAASAMTAYDGTLLLGAQHDAQGNVFRKSSTRVLGLQVYAGVMPEAELLLQPVQGAPMPGERVAPSVNCKLDGLFSGNGADRYVDMGVQLFAAADMSWTLDTVIRTTPDQSVGVYMSCFSEVPGEYRGLLVRQEDAELCVILGSGASVRLPLTTGSMHLIITRDGDEYAVYADGKLAGRVTSSCARYEGTLLVGAQRDAQDELFRFSQAKVSSLEVIDGALTEEQALEQSAPVVNDSRF